MYRSFFKVFHHWRTYGNIRNSIHRWSQYSQWSKKIHNKYYVSPLLGLCGVSMKDYGLEEEDIKKEAQKIEIEDSGDRKQSSDWETLVEETDLRVYRRRLPGKYELYEYKCSGTYYDISPRNFVDAQCDVQYRGGWDTNVISLDILESDEETDTQVIRWVAKFPYPMYPRIYIYVRRKVVDHEAGKIIVCSRALDEHVYPDDSKYVRVTWYGSSMLIHAHNSFDEDGLDYVLTYYDDPQANIPSVAYNWVVNRGGPYFLKQVHEAAKKLENKTKFNEHLIRVSSEKNNPSDSSQIQNYQTA